MKTWKTKRSACRSTKSGKFAKKGRCRAYKRVKIPIGLKTLFHM